MSDSGSTFKVGDQVVYPFDNYSGVVTAVWHVPKTSKWAAKVALNSEDGSTEELSFYQNHLRLVVSSSLTDAGAQEYEEAMNGETIYAQIQSGSEG